MFNLLAMMVPLQELRNLSGEDVIPILPRDFKDERAELWVRDVAFTM